MRPFNLPLSGSMTNPISSDDDKSHVIRLNLYQIRIVEEFVGARHLKRPDEGGQNLFIYATAKQQPAIWKPLLHKGKLIDLSGAEFILTASDEDSPYIEIDLPDPLSFKKENIVIEIPKRIYAAIIEGIRQKNMREVELLLHASIVNNSYSEESKEALRLEFGKIWLRSVAPLIETKPAFWKIVILLLLFGLLLLHI